MNMLAKTNLDRMRASLARIEKQLDGCRTSVLVDGWQTQKFAKKARKWDVLAQQKMYLKGEIDSCEDAEAMCDKCDCWKRSRAICS